MDRKEKSNLVSLVKDKLANNSFIAVVHYRGMSDKELFDMRSSLKEKDCGIKIAKNTLVKIAVKDTEFEPIAPHLVGPTAILYSQDPVALSKVLSDTAKQVESLKIITGFFDNKLVEESTIKSLAKLGSMEDVRASFIGRLKAVQSNFVRIVNAPNEGLASSFSNQVDAT